MIAKHIRTLAPCLAALCLAALACAGCGGLSKPAVTKHYYDIGPERPASLGVAEAPGDDVLVVRRLRVSPMNAGREMVYRTSDTGFRSNYYHAFFIPPGDMLSQSLRTWLHDSGRFSHVVEPASLLTGDLVLEGNVVALYGDYATGAEAVASMQFLLLDESGQGPRVLFSADYERREALPDDAPQTLAGGLKRAVADIFTELERDLAAALP